jgi:glycosyltransferase involved in cell wall biosynthesis
MPKAIWLRRDTISEVKNNIDGAPVLITVTICTLNHAESLRRTLQSLAAMRVPGDVDWEVVVVNNGSTDHTEAVIAAFAGRLPLRRELEPERGLSRARNCAVDAAKGDYVLWTDDDVVVDPGWLAAYAAAFRRHPEAAVFGGPVFPRYAAPVPQWILDNETQLRGVFAYWDIGKEEKPLWDAQRVYYMPCGPSFALRGAEQRRFRYNLKLGMAPGQKRRGEELDVLERIRRSGASGYWVPEARAEHCARPEMQTIRYISAYYKSSGETDAFLWEGNQPVKPVWFGVPRWVWGQLIGGWLRYQLHRRISPATVWLKHLRAYSKAWGAVCYWRGHERP